MRIQLIQSVQRLRNNCFTFDSLTLPQSVDVDEIVTPEGRQTRCRVVLTAHGCRVATCTMCPLPDEAVPNNVVVTTEHWLAQIRHALALAPAAEVLTLYHNGNFFADVEVSAERRAAIYDLLATTAIRTLVVESLPQFITDTKLQQAATRMPKVKLEVAIGLQSCDDFLRETVLTSPCTKKGFAKALSLLRHYGYEAQVFLMHQMPFLTPEEASVSLYHSVVELQRVYGVAAPTLCPLRIAPATVVSDLAARGGFEHGSLWHLVDVLNQLRLALPETRARVAVSLLKDNLTDARTKACPACSADVMKWINNFNVQAFSAPPPRCPCAPGLLNFEIAYDKAEVSKRIKNYLEQA